MKNKIATIGIIIATLILAGVAVFTAIRLYQLRQEAVAPTAPTSKPKAQETPIACQALAFTLGQTPTPTPTPTPISCNQSCNETVNPPRSCQQNLICYIKPTSPPIAGASGLCRNPNCTDEEDCLCGTATPTATPTPTPSGTPNSCNGTCGSNYNCQSGLFCYQGFCRNSSCPSDTDCTCPGTSTPTPTPTPTGTQAALPDAGTSLPTIFGIGLGTLLLIGAILLAL